MINDNTYGSLGPLEANIVARLTYEKKSIVTTNELDRLFKLSPEDRKQVVFRLKRKNRLTPIKPGVYIFSSLESGPAGRGINELLIPPVFFPKGNYYTGYSTMFNYYGFTEQLFQTVYVLNTTMSKQRIICGMAYKFIKIPANRLYGLETIQIQEMDVIISTKERTMIDLLYFNKPVGGVEAAGKIFRTIVETKKCDLKRLVEYAAKFPIVTTRKRAGILLEKAGISDSLLNTLAQSVQKTSISSLGRSRKGTLNKKWRVIIDASSG